MNCAVFTGTRKHLTHNKLRAFTSHIAVNQFYKDQLDIITAQYSLLCFGDARTHKNTSKSETWKIP